MSTTAVNPTSSNWLDVFSNLGNRYLDYYFNKKGGGIVQQTPRPPNPNPGNIIINYDPSRPSYSDNTAGGENLKPSPSDKDDTAAGTNKILYIALALLVGVLVLMRFKK